MTDFATTPNPSSTPSSPVPPELINPAPPVMPSYIPKRKAPILPLLFGFLIVITIAAAMGIAYYKTKLTSSTAPSPSPTIVATNSPEPSLEASATPSGSPKSSLKPSTKPLPTTTPKSSSPTATPTPTPVAAPTLDIRFGNPSANIKQTIDEGNGDGRVINREYTSIQAGQFDEVSSTWSPRVTVCYHLVSNEDVIGKNIKFSLSVDDKVEVEDNLGGYDMLEAGRIYDWCHDVTTGIGKHIARLTLNPDKSLKESNYTNSLGRVDWENLPDKIAPNYTITGPTQDGTKTCLTLAHLSDNVTKTSDLKIEEKYDAGSWSSTTATTYCTTGTSGSQHTYSVKVTDARGNVNEQSKTFVLY